MSHHVDVADRRVRDIGMHELVAGLVEQIVDVRSATGAQIVDTDDAVSPGEEAAADVAADEPGATGDHDPHGRGGRVAAPFGGAGRTGSDPGQS